MRTAKQSCSAFRSRKGLAQPGVHPCAQKGSLGAVNDPYCRRVTGPSWSLLPGLPWDDMPPLCLSGRSGCSQCPGTGNAAVHSVRHRHGLSSSIRAQTPVALPGFSAPAPQLQFTQACVGKRQPSVLDGNLTCQQYTGDDTSSGRLHWKGFCAKSSWGSAGSTARSSAAHSRAQPGATHLGRDVTKVAACGELLRGGLCSSAVWELLQFLCQTSIGHGWPREG